MFSNLSHLPNRAVGPPERAIVEWRQIADSSDAWERCFQNRTRGVSMAVFLHRLWSQDEGQDVAEYAVMLAVVLVIVVGTVRLVGANASNVFSSVASAIQ